MRSSKLLIITSGLGPGGTERCVRNYALMATQTGLQCHVLTEGRGQPYYTRDLEEAGVTVTVLAEKSYRLAFNRGLQRLIKEKKITHVVDFRGDLAGMSVVAAKLSRIVTVMVMYRNAANLYRHSLSNRISSLVLRLLVYLAADKISSNSQAALNFFYPHFLQSRRFSVVPNGVNLKEFPVPSESERAAGRQALGISEHTILLTNVGRLIPQKNQTILLELTARLRQKFPVKLAIAGDGPLKNDLRAKADQLGLQRDVLFLGHVNNVKPLLSATDLFVFPSLYEGMPNALLEAVVLGVPTIASRIPEIEELNPKGSHMRLVNPRSVDALSDACSNAISNFRLSKARAQQMARQLRSEWDLGKCFCALLKSLEIECM